MLWNNLMTWLYNRKFAKSWHNQSADSFFDKVIYLGLLTYEIVCIYYVIYYIYTSIQYIIQIFYIGLNIIMFMFINDRFWFFIMKFLINTMFKHILFPSSIPRLIYNSLTLKWKKSARLIQFILLEINCIINV